LTHAGSTSDSGQVEDTPAGHRGAAAHFLLIVANLIAFFLGGELIGQD
jgi:hypothetical protein